MQLRNGSVVTIQLSPAETVQLKDIMTSEQISTRGQYNINATSKVNDPIYVASEPEAGGGVGSALSSGAVAGIVLGALAAVILLLLVTLLIGFLVFKASRSKESQVSHT